MGQRQIDRPEVLNETLSADPYKDQFVRWTSTHGSIGVRVTFLIPLLNSLWDALEEDPQKRFLESANKPGEILFRLGADALLKSLTADRVSLEKLEKAHVGERGRTESVIRRLQKLLAAELAAVRDSGAKLVVFDDLDRCEPADIINVVEAVKLFVDLENAFVTFALAGSNYPGHRNPV